MERDVHIYDHVFGASVFRLDHDIYTYNAQYGHMMFCYMSADLFLAGKCVCIYTCGLYKGCETIRKGYDC